MEEEEEEEDKKREREYFCRRDFLTQYKAPVTKKHSKIVYLGAHFAGRGRLIATILVCIYDGRTDGSSPIKDRCPKGNAIWARDSPSITCPKEAI